MQNRKKITKIIHKNILGFILIELLVVIFIIGLLAALSVVGLSAAKSKSRDAKTLSNMNSLKKAISLYAQNYEPISYPAPNTWLKLFSVSWLGKYTNLAPLQPPKNDANSYYFYAYSTANPVGYIIGGTIENGNDALKGDFDDYDNAAIQEWADGIVGVKGAGPAFTITDPTCQDIGDPPTSGVYCIKVMN
jgi:type II secretory pathway pseudopilin PulG